MAIFTASQATQAVVALSEELAAEALSQTIASYQAIFDLIKTASATGSTSITWTMSHTDYAAIGPILTSNGYTVSSWTGGSGTLHSQVTISWPSTTATTYPSMVSILPTQVQGNQNTYFSAVFAASGGVAPYTYSITGAIPTGLSFSTLASVYTITLSGTPTTPANEYNSLTITATDQVGQTLSQTVTWTISASTLFTIVTNTPGTEALAFNATTNQFTFTPYLLPTATSSQLGGVKIDNTTITVNGQGQIQYQLPTATTAQLGAVKPDNSTILISAGVISVNPATTLFDSRMKALAIAAGAAFGI